MAKITRALLLRAIEAHQTAVEKVLTPEWDGVPFVYVRYLDAVAILDAEQLEEAAKGATEMARNVRAAAAWCAIGICDERGVRQFEDGDIDRLMRIPFKLLIRCADAIARFNGLTEEGESKRKKSARPTTKKIRVRPRKGTRPC